MGRNKTRNNNKVNQPHNQVNVSNTQIQTTELPNKRKKRNQTVEQVVQVQPPRQSVFERLGTKNSGTAPLPRQPTNKKEIKDHPSGNETRKSRRISDARKAEREQSESELKQESTQDVKNKPESTTKRNIPISKVNPNNTIKGGRREDLRPGKPLRRNSYRQLEQKQTIRKDDFQELETLSPSNAKDIQKEELEEDTKISYEMSQTDTSLKSPTEYDVQNTEQVLSESNDVEAGGTDETDRVTPENLTDSTEFIVQQQNNAVYEHVSGLIQSDHESDTAKEDVVSIQADDEYLMGIEDEDQEEFSFDQEFSRERTREKDHGKNKDIDAKDISLRMRNRASSDDGRNSDRSYDRLSRETSIQQPHVDDRRTRIYERDIREREREERYNRAIATDRAHDDRDRRERERQDRYNKSIMEDKAHLDIPRRNERDRFQREFERNRGSRTPNAETSSNSTIRGATSRSPSDSDRDRKPPSRARSPERVKREDRDLRPRDDVPRDREWPPHQDFQRDRDRMSRQREDLSNRDRDPRIRDLSKEKELSSRELKMQDRDSINLRRGDQMDVMPFRRLDERVPNVRRLDDPRNNIGIPDRNPRDPLPRDREKDSHYHRDQALRPESIRRDERQPAARSKNETQNDPTFQDNRDKELRQRNVQPNALTEHDHRPDKRKREEIDPNERKTYYNREQVNFNQRLPDYRIRIDKERDQRHREDYSPKDSNRAVINRDQDATRKEDRVSPHDRNVGLPDLYRPSSDHHLKEPDRRSIREYERDYSVDRYRADDREIRDRVRDDHESRSDSVDRHQREPEKRISRDIGEGTNRLEPTRRADSELSIPSIMDDQRDNIRDYLQETHIQEDKRDSQDQLLKESKKASINEDEDPPHPWIRWKSSRNKFYYFNTQTRESQWNYPETGKNRHAQNDGKDDDDSRKKIRLNESGDSIVTNAEVSPQIEHEDKTINTIPAVNENGNKEASLKEEISFDQQSESPSRPSRSNSTFLFSPSVPQAQLSPGMSTVFPSEYDERRFSADYGSPRRGSYVGSQPHSPQMPSRSNPNPFNRGGSVDLYDDGFRNEDFISNRSLGDPRNIASPSGNNNSGPAFPGSPIRAPRSRMYPFGTDSNASPGSRRSISAGVGSTYTQQSSMSRVRSIHEEERQFHGEEQSMEVDELRTNEVHKYEMDLTNNGQGYEVFTENVDDYSDEDTWRSDNGLIEYGAAETEPVSIFLFRRARSRMDQNGVKKKFLNPRKEYESMKAICGGKGMHLFKHSFATAHRE